MQLQQRYKLVLRSQNSKISRYGIPAIYGSKSTCPLECPFKNNGCYAQKGHVNITFNRFDKNLDYGVTFPFLIKEVAKKIFNTIMRVDVSGDLPTNPDGKLDIKLLKKFVAVLAKNKVTGWSYTHHRDDEGLLEIQSDNFVVHKSVHTLDDAVEAFNKGLPVALALDKVPKPIFWYKGVLFKKCWNQSDKKVTCQDCGWCLDSTKRFVIVFEKH